jgi:hypothetical protein
MSAQVTFSPPVQRVPMGLVPDRGDQSYGVSASWLARVVNWRWPDPSWTVLRPWLRLHPSPLNRKSFGLNAVLQEAEASGD